MESDSFTTEGLSGPRRGVPVRAGAQAHRPIRIHLGGPGDSQMRARGPNRCSPSSGRPRATSATVTAAKPSPQEQRLVERAADESRSSTGETLAREIRDDTAQPGWLRDQEVREA